MDSKLLCPTLSVMLVKTIKALCEINIHYDQKLEITGSLHVRSDGNKVLTCLLDEETVKGSHHETAARVAELAARLSLANAAAFTFQHVQPTVVTPVAPVAGASVTHSQQVAEALLSSMQGNTNVAAISTHSSHITSNSNVAEYGGYFLTPSVTAAAQSVVTPQPANVDCNSLTLMRMSPISPPASIASEDGVTSWQSKSGRFSAAIMPSSTSSTLRQKNGDIADDTAPRKPGRRVDTVAKTLAAIKASNSLTSRTGTDLGSQSAVSGTTQLTADVAAAAINHIKLPDIQTLANRLPGFHSSGAAASIIDIKPIIDSMSPSSSSVSTDTLATTWTVPSVQSEKLVVSSPPAAAAAVDVEIASDLSAAVDAGAADNSSAAPGKKKFQCMFCGIFLSTKCYLKNHINAVHTRSRIYQCDLCAHYFYSAGAARIHKLRNHWHNAKKHRCSECAETFLLPIELRKHIQKKHYGSAGYQLLMESGEVHQPITNTSDASVDDSNATD